MIMNNDNYKITGILNSGNRNLHFVVIVKGL